MTAAVRFTVPGRPVPAARMTQRGKYRRGGREERHLAHKDAIGWCARSVKREAPWFGDGPVRLRARFYVHGRSPDLKNMVALVEDALNGLAYDDDRQVRAYSDDTRIYPCGPGEERTEIVIEALPTGVAM